MDLDAAEIPPTQTIPIKRLMNALESIKADDKRKDIEAVTWARAMLAEAYPVRQWMPVSMGLLEMNDSTSTDAEASVDQGTMDLDAPVESTPAEKPGLPETETSHISTAGVSVPVLDETNGITVHGKVVRIIKYGAGHRVFVDYGTEKNPIHDVLPGREFRNGRGWHRKSKIGRNQIGGAGEKLSVSQTSMTSCMSTETTHIT